jgi:hypothetical protein
MVSEAYMVMDVKGWIVDSVATRHICGNKEDLSFYKQMEESTDRAGDCWGQ